MYLNGCEGTTNFTHSTPFIARQCSIFSIHRMLCGATHWSNVVGTRYTDAHHFSRLVSHYVRLTRMKNARSRLKCVHVQSILCLVCDHILMNESVLILLARVSRSFVAVFIYSKSLSTSYHFPFAILFDHFYLRGEHSVWILCTPNVYIAVSLFTDERTNDRTHES